MCVCWGGSVCARRHFCTELETGLSHVKEKIRSTLCGLKLKCNATGEWSQAQIGHHPLFIQGDLATSYKLNFSADRVKIWTWTPVKCWWKTANPSNWQKGVVPKYYDSKVRDRSKVIGNTADIVHKGATVSSGMFSKCRISFSIWQMCILWLHKMHICQIDIYFYTAHTTQHQILQYCVMYV